MICFVFIIFWGMYLEETFVCVCVWFCNIKQKDGYGITGCYNLECPGFVHINQGFALGAAVHAVSTLDGEQAQFPATIWKVNIIRDIFHQISSTSTLLWYFKI